MDSSQSDPDQRTGKVEGGERGELESQENSKSLQPPGGNKRDRISSALMRRGWKLENTQPSPRRLSIQGVLS